MACWHGPQRERGTALLEFALVVPVVALLTLGIVDLGRAYRIKTRLTNAAREGAVFAQYFPARVDSTGLVCADPGNIVYVVRSEGTGQDTYAVTVRKAGQVTPITGCDRTTVAPGTDVVVSASTSFSVMTPLVSALVGSRLTLRADVEVTVQG